jgi:hypothetical protein
LTEIELYEICFKRRSPPAHHFAGQALQVFDLASTQTFWHFVSRPSNLYPSLTWQPRTPEITLEANLEDVICFVEVRQVRLAVAADIEGFAMYAPETQSCNAIRTTHTTIVEGVEDVSASQARCFG